MPEPIENIISKCRRGDPNAFERLVDEYQVFAYALAFRLLGRSDEASDVAQEAFIRVWKNISRMDESRKFSTWLYRIVVNLCYDVLKRRKRREAIFVHNEDHSEFACGKDIEEDIHQQETVHAVLQLTARLPLKQRMVFILRDIQDVDIADVAEILSMSARSVCSNLYHARSWIREKLKEMEKHEVQEN